MIGDISGMTTRRDSRSTVSTVGVNTQDYLITTMKLRDRVLTARAPAQGSYRKTIRQLRSAPPFQNRNLDNYPMSYKREDAVKSARGFRADKREKNTRMAKERADSGLMRDYSKQMFDFSVKNVNNTNGYRNGYEKGSNKPTRTMSEPDNLAAMRTNGPTPDGSILHNRRQKVLNSIRIRPHPEYENQYHHERTCSRLSVQNTISDKNRHYRIRSVSESIRPVSVVGNVSIASCDFIFEPVDQSSVKNDHCRADTSCTRRATMETPMSTYDEIDSIEGVFGKDPFDDIAELAEINDTEFKSRVRASRPSIPALLPPDIVCNIRLVSLDEESASESEEEKVEPVPEVKKPEPPPPPPSKSSRGKKKNVKIAIVEEEKKIPEPEPEPEPAKVKLILKGPHCWVDDATITSDLSEDEKEDNLNGNGNAEQHPQSDGVVERLNSTQKLDNTSKTKALMKGAIATNVKTMGNAILKQPNQQSMKNAFEKALENVQSKPNGAGNGNVNNKENTEKDKTLVNELIKTEEQTVEDEKVENEVKLPPFLCPSSEQKSRQAALKDWLAHTCFETGHRGVPIV